jgi:hypothetical protein
VVLTPRRWRQVCDDASHHADDGDNEPVTGESAKETVKTIARGKPGDFRRNRGDYRVLTTFCTRAAGASGTRLSLRPPLRVACALIFRRDHVLQNSGKRRRENADVCPVGYLTFSLLMPWLSDR